MASRLVSRSATRPVFEGGHVKRVHDISTSRGQKPEPTGLSVGSSREDAVSPFLPGASIWRLPVLSGPPGRVYLRDRRGLPSKSIRGGIAPRKGPNRDQVCGRKRRANRVHYSRLPSTLPSPGRGLLPSSDQRSLPIRGDMARLISGASQVERSDEGRFAPRSKVPGRTAGKTRSVHLSRSGCAVVTHCGRKHFCCLSVCARTSRRKADRRAFARRSRLARCGPAHVRGT